MKSHSGPYKLRSSEGAGATTGAKSVGQFGIYLVLLLSLVPYGAVHDLTKLILAVFTSFVAIFVIWIDIRKNAVRSLVRDVWIVLFLLVLYIIFQSLKFEGNPFSHPFWQSAGDLAGFQGGAISVEPSLTILSLFVLVPPFLLFISILHAFQGDNDLWRLTYFLGFLAFAFIIYGLIQAAFFPNYTFLRELDRDYHAFTSTLIYRNSAATLVGVSSLVFLAILIKEARGISFFSLPAVFILSKMITTKRRAKLIFWFLALFLSLIALFLTQSRGALGATILAWAIVSPPLLSRAIAKSFYGETGFHNRRLIFARRVLFVLLIVAVVIGFLNIFAEETLFRFAELKGENSRFCLYPSMWRSFLDNWQFGSGFGTFEAVFPIYRDPGCGVTGVWKQAHNFWLEGLMGLGIVFVPIVGFSVYRISMCFVKGIRTRNSLRFICHIGIAVLALIGLHSFVEFSMQIPGVAFYGTAVTAALCGQSLGRTSARRKDRS